MKKPKSKVFYDPGFQIGNASTGNPHQGRDAFRPLKFEDGEPLPEEELKRKRMLAMMLAKKDRESRPICPFCNTRRVGRVGKGLAAPLDAMCGICSAETMQSPRILRMNGPRSQSRSPKQKCRECGETRMGRMVGNDGGIGYVFNCEDCLELKAEIAENRRSQPPKDQED